MWTKSLWELLKLASRYKLKDKIKLTLSIMSLPEQFQSSFSTIELKRMSRLRSMSQYSQNPQNHEVFLHFKSEISFNIPVSHFLVREGKNCCFGKIFRYVRI